MSDKIAICWRYVSKHADNVCWGFICWGFVINGNADTITILSDAIGLSRILSVVSQQWDNNWICALGIFPTDAELVLQPIDLTIDF